jgi:methyl-accepting chemotaxis protein
MSWLLGSLRGRVLAVTGGSLVAVSVVVGMLGLWGQTRTFGETERLLLETQAKVLDRVISTRLQELTKATEAFIRPLEIQDALAARNAEALVENARPPFNRLGRQAGLGHLAYYDGGGNRLLALPGMEGAPARRMLEAVIASKQVARGIDRVDGEPVLAVLQPVYRRGEFVGVVHVDALLRHLAPELAQTLNARGALLAKPPGPADAVAFHGMALIGANDEFRALVTSLSRLPPAGRASIETLKAAGSSHALTLHPLRSAEGEVQGVVMLATDVTGVVRFMRSTLVWLLVGTAVTAGAAIVSTSVLVSRRLQPLAETAAALEEIARGGGDLTRRLEARGTDEISALAGSFNTFMDKLHDIVGRVKAAAVHTAAVSQQLSTASTDLAAAAQAQSSSVEETAASLEELTSTVRQNADRAREANQRAGGSRDTAQKGRQVVVAAMASMTEITRASKRIGEILVVIDEIAFQTNLLALNAAVEAARAGEQGRGFAVVAAEVRSLAQRAAAAAREIKTLIQDSIQKVEDGSALVTRSGQTLEEIVTSVNRVTDIIAEITAASQEQSQGIEQVNRAVGQMDQSVQQNAANADELSTTAQSLAGQARQIQELVLRFQLSGDQPAPPAAAPRPADDGPSPGRLESILSGRAPGDGVDGNGVSATSRIP